MQKSNKLVLFDIDHTIFNGNLYRDKLYKNLAEELKCDIDDFKIGEAKYKKIRDTKPYLDPNSFLEIVIPDSKKPYDAKKIHSIFWDKDLYESCVFPDVKKAFSYLSEKGIQIGIFSTGDLAHQKIKIESLKEYLSENHIFISPDKFKIIKGTMNSYKNYQIYLIDDYPQILENTKFHNKNVFTVFIKRKESYSAKGIVMPENFKPDAIITNLSQLTDIIRTGN